METGYATRRGKKKKELVGNHVDNLLALMPLNNEASGDPYLSM